MNTKPINERFKLLDSQNIRWKDGLTKRDLAWTVVVYIVLIGLLLV